MAAYEDSYAPMLEGVSQQVARERTDGQVEAQENMLSDPVRNVRRRFGAQYEFFLDMGATVDPTKIAAWDTVIGGERAQVILNTDDGVVRILNSANTLVHTADPEAYLVASTAANVQSATVGDTMYLVNLESLPERGIVSTEGTWEGDKVSGFFTVVAGAFSKTYTVTVKSVHIGLGVSAYYTGQYTTPDGTGEFDAALATPEAIATGLLADLTATVFEAPMLEPVTPPIDGWVRGASVFIQWDSALITNHFVVGSESGSNYIVVSADSQIRQEADLPVLLPAQADGYLISVGTETARRFYRYEDDDSTWREAGDASSPMSITDGPCTITYDGSWDVAQVEFTGRFAGDDTTNPDPQFVGRGISGVSAYQGRLVLLSGNIVSMSATNQPLQFYRSTVTSLLESDPIGIGSTGTAAAEYRHAVEYSKDLVVFSDKNQAVVPGSTSAVTPRSAVLLGFSEYVADMSCRPLQVGKSLMFAAPRSPQNFGVYEMLPNGNTASMYDTNDATPHLPTYMAGQCRFALSSSVGSVALFASSTLLDTLYVYEYAWQGNEKIQAAWHKWSFPFDIAAAYFKAESAVVLFAKGEMLVGCKLNSKGAEFNGSDRVARMDMAVYANVVDRTVAVPDWLLDFLPTDDERDTLRMQVAQGDLAGDRVGFTHFGGVFTTVSSYPDGRVAIGIPYLSLITPTPPMRKDYKGTKISTNKMTLLRYCISTNLSGVFDVSISDGGEEIVHEDEYSPLTFDSDELELDEPMEGGDAAVVVPARTRAERTLLTISTDGLSELNVVGLEFVANYHSKITRRGG